MTDTFDLTPTWADLMPALVAVLQGGTTEGRDNAAKELARMAQVADQANLWAPVVSRANALVDQLQLQGVGTLTPDSMLALENLETALGEA